MLQGQSSLVCINDLMHKKVVAQQSFCAWVLLHWIKLVKYGGASSRSKSVAEQASLCVPTCQNDPGGCCGNMFQEQAPSCVLVFHAPEYTPSSFLFYDYYSSFVSFWEHKKVWFIQETHFKNEYFGVWDHKKMYGRHMFQVRHKFLLSIFPSWLSLVYCVQPMKGAMIISILIGNNSPGLICLEVPGAEAWTSHHNKAPSNRSCWKNSFKGYLCTSCCQNAKNVFFTFFAMVFYYAVAIHYVKIVTELKNTWDVPFHVFPMD